MKIRPLRPVRFIRDGKTFLMFSATMSRGSPTLRKEHRTAAASLKGSGKVQLEPPPRRPARTSLPCRPYRVPCRRKIFYAAMNRSPDDRRTLIDQQPKEVPTAPAQLHRALELITRRSGDIRLRRATRKTNLKKTQVQRAQKQPYKYQQELPFAKREKRWLIQPLPLLPNLAGQDANSPTPLTKAPSRRQYRPASFFRRESSASA